MGKNSSIYFSDVTLDKLDSILKEWDRQDLEDNWNHKRSKSDVVAYAIHVLYDLEVSRTMKLEKR